MATSFPGKQTDRLRQIFQVLLGIVFRHPVLSVSLIAIQDDGQIVLVRKHQQDQWGLPGGIVDWGQTLTQTIHRELQEETGLDIAQIGRLVGIYSSPTRDPRMHSICVAVEVKVKGTINIHDTGEIAEAKPFWPEHLQQQTLVHDHNQHLHDYWQGLTTLG